MTIKSFIDREEERLTVILDKLDDEFQVALEDRAKLCASNFILQVGAKATLAADGYLAAAVQIVSASIIKMVDEGYLTLTDKAIASDAEIAERVKARDERAATRKARSAAAPVMLDSRQPGNYL